MISPAEILGPNGRIAARLANYEHRDEQLAMADAVAEAIQNGHHLVVEAGTGVGKSFAYLAPAILATAEKASRNREFPDTANRTQARRLPSLRIRTRLPAASSSPRTRSASRNNCSPKTSRSCGA